MSTDGCKNDKDTRIDTLEHVEVIVHLQHTYRGDIILQLTSPSGTKSEVLSLRPQDDSSVGINFKFMTVHNWAEDPTGEWKLSVSDSAKTRKNTGTLLSWSLILYGTWNTNVTGRKKYKFSDRSQDDKKRSRDLSKDEVKNIMERESEVSQNLDIRYNRGIIDKSITSRSKSEENQENSNKFYDRDYLLNKLGEYVKSEEKESSKRNQVETDVKSDESDIEDEELYSLLVRYLDEKEQVNKVENCEENNSCKAQQKRKFTDKELNELLEVLKNLNEE